MRRIQKMAALALVLAAVLCNFAGAAAEVVPGEGEAHIDYTDGVYGSDAYLYDTLTLAGSGFDQQASYTLYALEKLAQDRTLGLYYSNHYSLLTSGSVHSTPLFSGLKLYDLLVYSGLDTTLPDTTPVKCIAKDGYSIPLTLGALRSGAYSRFAAKDAAEAEETGLPVLLAYASNGVPLVGPTGEQPVYKKFTEAEGFVGTADNIGGPLRLVVGQTEADEFNAPNCSKWIAAVVVGDANGYVYEREVADVDAAAEPEAGGDWTHGDLYPAFRLTIRGSEAKPAELTLAELEGMQDAIVREYYAASAGKAAYEGVVLRELVAAYLRDGVEAPSKVTLISRDEYTKSVDLNDLANGIDSQYQPGKHKEMLLAYAINGAPLVASMEEAGYNGENAYGPLRLIVENTISAWVKDVTTIVIGEDAVFSDLTGYGWAKEAIEALYDKGIVNGTGDGKFAPGKQIKRGDFMLMLVRAYELTAETDGNFADVKAEAYYADAIAVARALGIAKGDGVNFQPEASITREEAMALLYRTMAVKGVAPAEAGDLSAFSDADEVKSWFTDAVSALAGAGIINGSDGKLNPAGYMTRAQLSVALYNALGR